MPTSKNTGVFLPHEFAVIIGVHTVTGWSDDVFATLRQLTPNVNDSEGASGETGIIIANSSKFELDINILQTSKDNDVFSGLHRATITLGTVYPLRLEDPFGKTLGVAGSTLFRQRPDASWNKNGVETRTWTLFIPHFEYTLGGNVN